ncbi:MAG: DUF4157 domain-containing protein [Thermoanaerobaculia bacterium]
MLQRKCAGGGGCCSDCDREKLQRNAAGPAPQRVPRIVHDVLRSSGEPLDQATRNVMEPRFAHDFSRVRVHRDARAAESAAAVGARAYTVGRNVVLGRNATHDVLAHELAHTIQQEGASLSGGELEIGHADDPLERDADGMAHGQSERVLRRQAAPLAKNQEPTTEQHAGHDVKPEEKTKASEAIGEAKIKIDAETLAREEAEPPATKTPRFILHDSAAKVNADGITAQVEANRGPLGKGVSAYVPRTDSATITRPFFETYRPTTTRFEKGLDTLQQDKKQQSFEALEKQRDTQFRKVWSLVDPKFYESVFMRAMTAKGLNDDQLAGEREGKNEGGKPVAGVLKQFEPPYKPTSTSGGWAIEVIVDSAKVDAGAKKWAVEGKAAELKTAATALVPYFAARNKLVSETVTAEMVQPKEGVKFESPSYSDNQYANVRALYLRAALAAKVYPETTTHRRVDEKYSGSHYDPRCFNLGRFYDDIATAVGHKVGTSRYGIEPTYGPEKGTAIWWGSVCAEAKPK